MGKAKLVEIEGKPGVYTYEGLERTPETMLKVELESLQIEYEIKRRKIIEKYEEHLGRVPSEKA